MRPPHRLAVAVCLVACFCSCLGARHPVGATQPAAPSVAPHRRMSEQEQPDDWGALQQARREQQQTAWSLLQSQWQQQQWQLQQRQAPVPQTTGGQRQARSPPQQLQAKRQQQPTQKQQQPKYPGGSCRYADTPLPGGSLVRSYGFAMVGGDRLAPLPTKDQLAGEELVGRDKDLTAGTLVCIASSGIDAQAAVFSDSTLTGCMEEHPLDPGGCPFQWDKDATGTGTHLASIVAGSVPGQGDQGLGIYPGAQLHSVRVWDHGTAAGGTSGDGAFASDRLLPYTVCEGRMRGLQASSFARSNYRMVVLLDVMAKQPSHAVKTAPAGSAPATPLYPDEHDWLQSAASYKADMLWVAPAGDTPGVPVYPASLSASPELSNRVLSVGAVDCNGRRWPAGAQGKVDLLAPGVDIAGSGPSAAAEGSSTATLSLAAASGDTHLTLSVLMGGAARGRPETGVNLRGCKVNGPCPSSKSVCVLPVTVDRAGRATCDILARGDCAQGVIMVQAPGSGPLQDDSAMRPEVEGCTSTFSENRPRPTVLVARGADGVRLAALTSAGGRPQGRLLVAPPIVAVRNGTSQAAAWVAGGAARLMERFPMCDATAVGAAMVDTAAILGPDGAATGARGRGGLLQLHAAEKQLEGQACAKQKLPVPTTGGRPSLSGSGSERLG